MATVGSHISDRGTAHVGYRQMHLERSTDSLSLDVDMTGPVFGLTHRF